MKSNNELVAFCKRALAERWNYTYAHYGQIVTKKSIDDAAGRFPVLFKKYANYLERNYRGRKDGDGNAIGKRGADCIGLIKGFMWWNDEKDGPDYDLDTDVNEAEMLKRSTVKGKIGTMPDKAGLLVYYSGHVGVYIGGGKVIEARGVDYGVVQTDLKSRAWTDWSECPYIDYSPEEKPEPAPAPAPVTPQEPADGVYIVKDGDTLWKIAERFLGDGARYRELAKLNNISDPNKIYKGQVIKLLATPAPAPVPTPAPAPVFKPYMVQVTVNVLNIRSAPTSDNDNVVGAIRDRGAYTIVDEKNGWGKLKSGAGWIYLEYTKRI